MAHGIIYIMTSSIDGVIKIGKAERKEYKERTRKLEVDGYRTLAMHRYFASYVSNYHEKEKLIHEIFGKSQLGNSELFALDKDLAKRLIEKYRVHLYDHIEKKEIKLKFKHIIQELLRPTPSPILPTDKCLKIEKALNTFDYWYMLCKEYKNEFGHLYLEHNEKYQEHALGYWCSETRIAYNRGELSQEQIDTLNEIGFIWDVVFYLWNKRFEEYKAYVEETGNYFPRTDCIHNDNKVGVWFLGQRKERKRGNLNPIYEKILLDYYPDFFKERDGWLNRKR